MSDINIGIIIQEINDTGGTQDIT